MWRQEFWRESLGMEGIEIGYGDRSADEWILTWTIAVILLIFACRVFGSGFRKFLFGRVKGRLKNSESNHPPPQLRTLDIVSNLDLKTLIDDLDENFNSTDGAWENICDKSSNLISYKAKYCKPKIGPLKYMSVTTFEDCSVEMLVNFYMDNHYRMMWDKTVVHHEQLQMDPVSGTEIGRTIKKFPFLTPREYVLAWKLWQGKDGSFYCFSKECEHPSAPRQRRYVRVVLFRSGWKIMKVPGRNACDIRMVHQEDAGLNVEMAKLAFSKGIWSYVCKMGDALHKYSTGRKFQLSSTANVIMFVQKVPSELEIANDTMRTLQLEKSVANARQKKGTGKSKLSRRPSKKLIYNGLILLGGAFFLSKGHPNLGVDVGLTYLLGKLSKRSGSSIQTIKHNTSI